MSIGKYVIVCTGLANEIHPVFPQVAVANVEEVSIYTDFGLNGECGRHGTQAKSKIILE